MTGWVVRFSRRQRLEHAVVMTLFLVLAVTGFPQKFHEAGWASGVVAAIGGVERMRWIHRLAGVLFSLAAVAHVMGAVLAILRGRAEASMVPTRQDFADAVVTLRYYLGIVERPPRFGRFDYRQKFEYWGLLLGGMMMIATGFTLLFPVLTTRWLPGELVPAAKLGHSSEGLMALLVVVTWHVYHAHLSPETFPFDRSIFDGRISRQRMEHEHPLELARLGGPTPSRSPSLARLAWAPVAGALLVLFLPFAGFALVGREAVGWAASRLAALARNVRQPS